MARNRILAITALFLLQSFITILPSTAVACSTSSTTLSGTGTSGDPYLIQNKDDLVFLSFTDSYWNTNKYFKQTANIDLAGCEWTPIGSSAPSAKNFKGSYDGNFKTISNLFFDNSTSSEVGLFGVTTSNTLSTETIKNLGLLNVDIKAARLTGAFVGYVLGATDYKFLFATGTLEATLNKDYFGGLIGEGGTAANISDSYSRVNILGAIDSSAGLAGRLKTATKSYSTGSVPIAEYNSGLATSISFSSTINSTGSVWDITTSGQTKETYASGSTANGKTTAQMKTLSTFTGLSWAITDGWAEFNASTNIWGICTAVNDGYPFLQWQYTASTIDPTCAGYVDPNPPVINSGGGSSSTVSVTPTPSATATPKTKAKPKPSPSISKPVIETRNLTSGSRANPESLFKVLITEISDLLKPTIVNLLTINQDNQLDQNIALSFVPNNVDKKVSDLPSLVTIGDITQSSRIVIVDNSSAQVITADGGVLAVEAKDGNAAIPVDSRGRVQMVKSNNVESQGSGLAPNTEFAVYLFSDPQLLGIGKTDAQGSFFASFPVENELPVGDHTLQVKGLLEGGQTSSVSLPISVVESIEATQVMRQVPIENNSSSKFSLNWILLSVVIMIFIVIVTKRERLLILIKRRKKNN